MAYARFGAMIATSTVAMFGLMYLNTYALDHVFFSETRLWMALYMGAAMAVIMLAYMLGMYASRALNVAIFASAAVVFAASLWVVRSQALMDDQDYMRAMIPHHSIAILTSERAHIRGSARARAGRRHHRDPTPRDRRDEGAARRHRGLSQPSIIFANEESPPWRLTRPRPRPGPPGSTAW